MIGRSRTKADDETRPATATSSEREDVARAEAAESASEAVQAASEAVGDAATDAAAEVTTGEASELGLPGRPLNRHSPFYLGFFGGLGVMIAIGLVSLVTQLSSVLTLLAISLFLALGLDPVVQWLVAHGLKRGQAAAV